MKLLTENDVAQLPLHSLAFMGDAVYEQFIREQIVRNFLGKGNILHRKKVHYVNATYQAKAAKDIFDSLSEREQGILLRGRNSDPGAMPKHADPLEYRWATALEVLLGYLYLSKQEARLQELLVSIYMGGDTEDENIGKQ